MEEPGLDFMPLSCVDPVFPIVIIFLRKATKEIENL